MFKGECIPDDPMYSYNHLREKESQQCENVYDVSHTHGSLPTGNVEPAEMATTDPENKEGHD
jgi:hypothetical protein